MVLGYTACYLEISETVPARIFRFFICPWQKHPSALPLLLLDFVVSMLQLTFPIVPDKPKMCLQENIVKVCELE